MVSEEMHLNHVLEEHGIEALETDLGEYIIQLDHETPSHIIVPAIHKNRDQIARLFHEKIPNTPYTEVVEELNAIARKVLREKFFAGEVGVDVYKRQGLKSSFLNSSPAVVNRPTKMCIRDRITSSPRLAPLLMPDTTISGSCSNKPVMATWTQSVGVPSTL